MLCSCYPGPGHTTRTYTQPEAGSTLLMKAAWHFLDKIKCKLMYWESIMSPASRSSSHMLEVQHFASTIRH